MNSVMRSATKMVDLIGADPALQSQLQTSNDPIPALREIAAEAESSLPYGDDKLLYRIAIIVLGLLALLAAAGSLILAFSGGETPQVLVALGSASVGALVGLFAPSPTNRP